MKKVFSVKTDCTFLHCLESSMLFDLTLQGIEAISKVYIVNPKLDESKTRIEIMIMMKLKQLLIGC